MPQEMQNHWGYKQLYKSVPLHNYCRKTEMVPWVCRGESVKLNLAPGLVFSRAMRQLSGSSNQCNCNRTNYRYSEQAFMFCIWPHEHPLTKKYDFAKMREKRCLSSNAVRKRKYKVVWVHVHRVQHTSFPVHKWLHKMQRAGRSELIPDVGVCPCKIGTELLKKLLQRHRKGVVIDIVLKDK